MTEFMPQWPADEPSDEPGHSGAAEPIRQPRTVPPPQPISPAPTPRVTPTSVPAEPAPRRRLPILAVMLGLLAGLVLFVPAGYALRALTVADRPRPVPGATVASSAPAPALSPYEQSQLDYNRPKVGDGPLAALAQPWLPHVAACSRTGEQRGPDLGAGERVRVQCSYGVATIYFVQYKSTDARDKARAALAGRAIDARTLAPGVAEPTQRTTPSGAAAGNVIEYAYKQKPGDKRSRVVVGLWWDNTASPVAGYMLAYWDQLGESWTPLRDLWQRAS